MVKTVFDFGFDQLRQPAQIDAITRHGVDFTDNFDLQLVVVAVKIRVVARPKNGSVLLIRPRRDVQPMRGVEMRSTKNSDFAHAARNEILKMRFKNWLAGRFLKPPFHLCGMEKNSIHRFKIAGLEGGEIDFSSFAGRKILVVNVASACGLTPQYGPLQELSAHFSDRLAVVGMPCNDFAGQEPGSASEIKTFCESRFGVTFPLAEKVAILGPAPHPIYRFLTSKSENGHSDSVVAWNFQKYLLDEKGVLLAVFSPQTAPNDEAVLGAIG